MLDGKGTTVNLAKDQLEFLKRQDRHFNFSAFVRDRLYEYMEMVKKEDGDGK